MRAASAPSGTGTAEPPPGLPAPGTRDARDAVAVDVVGQLAHFWTRPDLGEARSSTQVRAVEVDVLNGMSSAPGRLPLWLPQGKRKRLELVDEYERLFVGPGQVPCPPYESFWREDVPIDVRRSLMGPCVADLHRCYRELGLVLSREVGELPDHIGVELEALAYAMSSEETRPVARRILVEHLAHFVPRLCRAVAKETTHGFYRDLARLTAEWFAEASRGTEAGSDATT